MQDEDRDNIYGEKKDLDAVDRVQADAFDSVTGLATTGGPTGAGVAGKMIAGPDLEDEVVGDPIDADYMADRRTNIRGNEPDDNETDTATGFAGEGGANPDAHLPPEER